MAKVSLAGIHYPDTTCFFGDVGIIEVTDQMAQRGWSAEGRQLYMADHYRATVDMIVRWALSKSEHCNVEVAEWFPSQAEKRRLFAMFDPGTPQLFELGKLQKMEAWLSSQ